LRPDDSKPAKLERATEGRTLGPWDALPYKEWGRATDDIFHNEFCSYVSRENST